MKKRYLVYLFVLATSVGFAEGKTKQKPMAQVHTHQQRVKSEFLVNHTQKLARKTSHSKYRVHQNMQQQTVEKTKQGGIDISLSALPSSEDVLSDYDKTQSNGGLGDFSDYYEDNGDYGDYEEEDQEEDWEKYVDKALNILGQ